MKKLFFLLFIIPFVFSCSVNDSCSVTIHKNGKRFNLSPNIIHDLDELNLKGKIKSITKTRFTIIENVEEPTTYEFVSREEQKFNKNGNLFKIDSYNWLGGETKTSWRCKSYELQPKIAMTRYVDKEIHWKNIFKYDIEGNLIVTDAYGLNGTFQGRDIYKYNYDDNIKENGNGLPYKMISEYASGLTSMVTIFKYDDYGNMIEEYVEFLDPFHNQPSSFLTRIYEYDKFDKNNNWIRRIEYHNGKAKEVKERIIKYYN